MQVMWQIMNDQNRLRSRAALGWPADLLTHLPADGNWLLAASYLQAPAQEQAGELIHDLC